VVFENLVLFLLLAIFEDSGRHHHDASKLYTSHWLLLLTVKPCGHVAMLTVEACGHVAIAADCGAMLQNFCCTALATLGACLTLRNIARCLHKILCFINYLFY
jgi:hypothetical protein